MNFFMEIFYCWIRNKEPTPKANQDQKEKINNQTKQQLICGGCFKDIESLDEFSQITKIGSRYYGVCSDECYNTWLNTPAAQCLAPINDYATLSLIRDNQQ